MWLLSEIIQIMSGNSAKPTFEKALKLQDLTRKFQKLNNYVSKDSTLGLNLSSLMVMLEFDPGVVLTVNEITSRTHFDQSTVSRIVSNLRKRGLLKNAPTSDARSRPVILTSLGEARLFSNDEKINKGITSRLKTLSVTQIKTMLKGLSTLSTALESPPTLYRKKDHPLRHEVRRMTKALGILERKVTGERLNTSEWNVLSEIKDTPTLLTSTDLANALFTLPKVMASIVVRLEKRGLIQRTASKRDKRASYLELTPKGIKELQSINNQAASFLQEAIRKEKSLDPDSISKALELYIYWRETADSTSGWSEARSPEDLALARGFVIREAVTHKIEDELPETICSKKGKVFICRAAGGEIKGVLDLSKFAQIFSINISSLQQCTRGDIVELNQLVKLYGLQLA